LLSCLSRSVRLGSLFPACRRSPSSLSSISNPFRLTSSRLLYRLLSTDCSSSLPSHSATSLLSCLSRSVRLGQQTENNTCISQTFVPVVITPDSNEFIADPTPLECMNRNKRRPKKANHGARPCSSVARKKKRLRRH